MPAPSNVRLDPGSATARAHPNIALSKYWGKRELARNLPAVPSLSAGLADLWIEATVTFDGRSGPDALEIDGQTASQAEQQRVTRFLDLVRERAGAAGWAARVATRSNFPRSAGLASSAAAFAALAIAASDALSMDLDPIALSALARRGSGSAARSLFEGYVELPDIGDDPAAQPVAPAEHLPLEVLVAITSAEHKPLGSRQAMQRVAETSPYYPTWVAGSRASHGRIRQALLERRFEALATESEANCLDLHATCLTARPAVVYWNAQTLALIKAVPRWRAEGLDVFFTIDAGPNVVLFCQPGHADAVLCELEEMGVSWRRTRVGGAPSRGGRG